MSRGSCFFVSLIKITSRWSRGWSLRYWREMVPLHGLEPGSGCPSPYERPLLYCGCLAGGPPPMFRSVHLPGPAHSSGGLDPISMFPTQKLLPAQRRHLVFPVVCVSLAPPMASPFSWWDPTPPDLHPLSHHPALFSPWLVPSSNTIYSSVWVLWWACLSFTGIGACGELLSCLFVSWHYHGSWSMSPDATVPTNSARNREGPQSIWVSMNDFKLENEMGAKHLSKLPRKMKSCQRRDDESD